MRLVSDHGTQLAGPCMFPPVCGFLPAAAVCWLSCWHAVLQLRPHFLRWHIGCRLDYSPVSRVVRVIRWQTWIPILHRSAGQVRRSSQMLLVQHFSDWQVVILPCTARVATRWWSPSVAARAYDVASTDLDSVQTPSTDRTPAQESEGSTYCKHDEFLAS